MNSFTINAFMQAFTISVWNREKKWECRVFQKKKKKMQSIMNVNVNEMDEWASMAEWMNEQTCALLCLRL